MEITVNDKKTVQNYPYGGMKTQATFSLEFDYKKGFRSVFQTINPKTGRINNPKKSTYNDIMYMVDNNGFITFKSLEFYKREEFNKIVAFLSDNFDLFTSEQVTYLYNKIMTFLKIEVLALWKYCNVSTEDSGALTIEIIKLCSEGKKDPSKNLFSKMSLDYEKLESLKDPNYNPFTVKSYSYNATH